MVQLLDPVLYGSIESRDFEMRFQLIGKKHRLKRKRTPQLATITNPRRSMGLPYIYIYADQLGWCQGG